jgi:hypothetical protein
LIRSAGIIACSQTLTHPKYPFVSLYDKNPSLQDILASHSTGDFRLDLSLSMYLSSDILDVLQAMRAYTMTVEAYHKGAPLGIEGHKLCDQRNLIQWHVLSLPAASQLAMDFLTSHPLYETCRISAVIFSLGVTFPLPPENAPLSILAKLLRVELCRFEDDMIWSCPVAIRVLCWALTLGGMAAEGARDREWFVSKLKAISPRHALSGWVAVKSVLKSVVWLDCACEFGGNKLWDEALYMR